ncbi:MAG: calcium/sodium antiporter [Bacteroidales bacterium]|nr:calcium/sodium antiporter [Bacteroidales bacterium]
MILNILLVIVGIALVLVGADKMTDGAVAIANKMKIPELIIGLTIVAMGTSAPELVVSLMSAIKGTPDLAVGNVLGSNIFNALLIVGVTAMVCPMIISKSTVKKDIPFAVGGSILLFAFAFDKNIERWESAILFVCLIIFMMYTIRSAKASKAAGEIEPASDDSGEGKKEIKTWLACVYVVLGISALIYGSDLFVDNASAIAESLGVSKAVIGLTIVAGGTSLPELATSVVAARKGQSALAIGNVIGSNVFNIFMIVGITGLVCPMRPNDITILDLSVMLGSVVLLWFFTYTKYKVERWEGAVLTTLLCSYMGWLIYNAVAA